jgi:thymidylate synthase (FAD)
MHRTASWNERSGRYSEMINEFYVPQADLIKGQGKLNKQGSEGEIPCEYKAQFRKKVETLSDMALANYRWALQKGISREEARILLPVNFYTDWYWGIDLHNLFHFLKLRNDWHAQNEIQVYAQAIEDLIKDVVPITYAAWKEYNVT